MITTWLPGNSEEPTIPMNPLLASQSAQAMSQFLDILSIEWLDAISLRAIPSSLLKARVFDRTYTINEFPDVNLRRSALERDAIRLNRCGYNVYAVLNRIRANIAGSHPVKDQDIASRRLLLIDIDRAARASCPASIPEIAQCFVVADKVRDFLDSYGLTSSCRSMSGNGIHLYYRLADLPNDAATTHLIKSVLVGLSGKFDTQHARIDTAVYNASRITKLPGTFAFKGIASAGREYRMASLLDPPPTKAVSASDLKLVATSVDKGLKPTSISANSISHAPRAPEPDTPRRRAQLQDALRFIPADMDRHDWRDIVWAILSTGWSDAAAIAEAWSKTAPHCFTQDGFNNVIASYDPYRTDSPTLGTIYFRAKEAGWNG